jgi:hypothetical protein
MFEKFPMLSSLFFCGRANLNGFADDFQPPTTEMEKKGK